MPHEICLTSKRLKICVEKQISYIKQLEIHTKQGTNCFLVHLLYLRTLIHKKSVVCHTIRGAQLNLADGLQFFIPLWLLCCVMHSISKIPTEYTFQYTLVWSLSLCLCTPLYFSNFLIIVYIQYYFALVSDVQYSFTERSPCYFKYPHGPIQCCFIFLLKTDYY